MAAFPDPDTLPEGQIVVMTDDSPFVGIVSKRIHLEADGSRRHYYLQLQFAGANWKYVAASATVNGYAGRYNPATNKVSAITSLADVPNCVLNSTVGSGGSCTVQRIGKALNVYVAADPLYVPGSVLTYNAAGKHVLWTPASPTRPCGYLPLSQGLLPLTEGIQNIAVMYYPFI